MAIQKLDALLIGKGNLLSNSTSVRQFSSTVPMAAWSGSILYPLDAMTEDSGNYFRSLINFGALSSWSVGTTYNLNDTVKYSGIGYVSLVGSNTGNQPDTSPSEWAAIDTSMSSFWEKFASAKDGDVAFIVAGTLSDIMVRNNTSWISLLNVPLQDTLSDNSLGQVMLQIPLAIARGATIEYSIQRGLNERRGTLRYQSDGSVGPTGVSITDSNIVDIGSGDVGVSFDAQVDGSNNVQILADTDNQSLSASVKYTLKGW